MLRLLEPVRRHRIRFMAVLAALAAAGAGLVVVPQLASAAAPVPITISVGKAHMTQVTVPAQDSKYSAFVFKDAEFAVPFRTSAPLSTSTTTKVTLSIDSGKTKSIVLGTVDLAPNDQDSEIIAPSGLPTVANNVTLTISVKGSSVTPGTTTVDVVGTHVSSAVALTGIGAGGGPGVPCNPTSTPGDQTCGDLVFPEGATVPAQLLTQGLCTTDCKFSGGSVLQWLATLSGVDTTHPVTFIAKCDKSLCSGKGIKSYHVFAQTDIKDTGGNPVFPTESLPCSSKGVVDTGKDFCTDYVQSTRDGAGDVLLYVLFAADAKIIW